MDLTNKISQLETRFATYEADIKAFLDEEGRFDRLYREAKELTARYPTPESKPPVFGLLLGVKDIFHVENFPTRAGSNLPPEILSGNEATVVRKLKAAGALVVGKTVTTEFAYFAPGPTRNPHNLHHTPGGSSSGSAAAVAVGLCEIGLGTQTIGSINRPAAFCGVIGFKPSFGTLSRDGVIPLSTTFDHVGYFSNQFDLLMTALKVTTERSLGSQIPDHLPVLGIPEGPYLSYADPEGKHHFQNTIQKLAESGYTIKRVPVMQNFEEIRARHQMIVAYEAAQVHSKWFDEYADRYHPKTKALLNEGKKIDPPTYQQACKIQSAFRNELTGQMHENAIDLWISPSAPGSAPEGLDSTGNPVMNLPWTHGGFPTLTIPVGKNPAGLPLGLQLTGGWEMDDAVLAWGEEILGALEMSKQGVGER